MIKDIKDLVALFQVRMVRRPHIFLFRLFLTVDRISRNESVPFQGEQRACILVTVSAGSDLQNLLFFRLVFEFIDNRTWCFQKGYGFG